MINLLVYSVYRFKMGFYYTENLEVDDLEVYTCNNCHSHLFTSDNIKSTDFRGRKGQGYLVDNVINFKPTSVEKRSMITGVYSVTDTNCHQCNHYLGWKYIKADSPEESYKEGCFVMEVPQLHSSRLKPKKSLL